MSCVLQHVRHHLQPLQAREGGGEEDHHREWYVYFCLSDVHPSIKRFIAIGPV